MKMKYEKQINTTHMPFRVFVNYRQLRNLQQILEA